MAWCGVIPMRSLNVTLRASLPAVAALNQNRPPRPDSTITVLATNIIELIVDSAAPFCHCSFGVLKWLLIPFESKNCIISSDLYSPALSRINTTNLCLARKSAMSPYHLFTTFNASSLVFMPYIHLYPVAASTNTSAWKYPSIDLTEDENESICIW